MADLILIVAPSGAGKTTSGRNLDPARGMWIVPEDKELPFKGFKKNFHTDFKQDGSISLKSNFIPEDRIGEIQKILIQIMKMTPEQFEKRPIDYIMIDTFTYAMLKSVMDKNNVDGYAKYVAFAQEFKDLIDTCKRLPKHIKVIITAHESVAEANSGDSNPPERSFKIPAGRFTAEKIVPEGLFTIVLWGEVRTGTEGNEYLFRTQKGNGTQAKSPLGMFDNIFIPNDLVEVFKKIDDFYNDEN